ncbi:MAG: Uma2 family endonuclease [Planctomycetes bacterium]|nr:Uma2 family endonuclease [Planctomycetota bacterium]
MSTARLAGCDSLVVLHDVSWRLYESLLREVGDRPVRLTYDRGELEIMSPSPTHEQTKKFLGRFIEILTLELDIPILSGGSTTFRRRDLKRGLEPDECYYIQNAGRIKPHAKVDLVNDPPPDLAVEVDVRNRSVDRQGIYAALGVPELWRWTGRRVVFARLTKARGYEAIASSLAFPFLSSDTVQRFLDRASDLNETALVRSFRDWVRKDAARRKR